MIGEMSVCVIFSQSFSVILQPIYSSFVEVILGRLIAHLIVTSETNCWKETESALVWI